MRETTSKPKDQEVPASSWSGSIRSITLGAVAAVDYVWHKAWEISAEHALSKEARRKRDEDAAHEAQLKEWLEKPAGNPGPKFVYDPLPLGAQLVTRVVRLEAGTEWDPIKISLSIAEPDQKFEALSYCWGSGNDRFLISCDGSGLNVTRNLKLALRNLRRETSPRYLWIDAICINQEDVLEREAQVKRMGEIFSGAERVVCWMGEESHATVEAFETLERLHKLYGERLAAGTLGVTAQMDQGTPLVGVAKESFPKGDEMVSVISLVRRPYLRRMWVVQEVALAKDMTMMCGQSELPWVAFQQGLDLVFLLTWQTTYFRFDIDLILTFFKLENARKAVFHGGQPFAENSRDFLVLVDELREYHATDPRDKVFAVVGMTNSNLDELGMSVSYKATAAEVYTALARAYVARSLNLLSIPHGSTDMTSSLPSWVPDWSDDKIQPKSFFIHDDCHSHCTPFNATAKSTLPPVKFRPDNQLILQGYRFDTIETLSSVVNSPVHDSEFMQQRYKHWIATGRGLGEWWDYGVEFLSSIQNQKLSLIEIEEMVLGKGHVREKDVYPATGENLELVLMRTLCSSHTPLGLDGGVESMREYREYRRPEEWLVRMKLERHRKLLLALGTAATMVVTSTHKKSFPFKNSMETLIDRRFGKTVAGYFGVVAPGAVAGDQIWLVHGGRLPLVLRPSAKVEGAMELVGDAYVHGIMYGEAWDEKRCGEVVLV